MLLLVDSTERFFFSFEFAKPFGRTKFLRSKHQYASEFSQIGTPHFSLEGVLYLRFISKATEKVVATRLNSYLDDNNLHELLQSAYKQGHSTETALVKVQNDISRSNDERKCVALLSTSFPGLFSAEERMGGKRPWHRPVT